MLLHTLTKTKLTEGFESLKTRVHWPVSWIQLPWNPQYQINAEAYTALIIVLSSVNHLQCMPTYPTSILLTLIVTIMKELHILNIPLTSIFLQPQMSLYQQWKILSHKLVHLNTRAQGKRILNHCMEHYLLLLDPFDFQQSAATNTSCTV